MKIESLSPSARVMVFKDGTRVLISYETPVAAIMPNGDRIRTEMFYSRTTLQHIGRFFKDDGSARIVFATVPQSVITALMEAK